MKSFKPLFLAALFLFSCQAIGDAKGSKPPVADINQPTGGSEPLVASVEAHTTTHKPEDYYIPLDNWLKSQGSPLNGKDFYEVGREYHLDPDMLIAITKAETNLGKVTQRGVSCNIGSVGSFDSTQTTYGCSSYRDGIEQIARTLNNQLLGSHVAVGQLSRAHNQVSHVYASSQENWERNVLSTLSALKGRPIDANYHFRTL